MTTITEQLAGLTTPVAGAIPDTSTSNTQYTTVVAWSPNDSVFVAGETYTATVTITPVGLYTLLV